MGSVLKECTLQLGEKEETGEKLNKDMYLEIIYAIMTLLNFWHYNGLMIESKTLSPSFSVFHLPQCQFLPTVVSPHGGKKAEEVPNVSFAQGIIQKEKEQWCLQV